MIDWSRVHELVDEIGAEDFGEVVELFLAEVETAIDLLGGAEGNRAERIQMIFSRQYDANWRDNLQMPGQ